MMTHGKSEQQASHVSLRCSGRRCQGSAWSWWVPLALFSGLLGSLPGSSLAQQTDTFTSVSSIPELAQAVASAQHIVLNNHLDLSLVPLQPNSEWMYPLQGVRSIRVWSNFSLLHSACFFAPRTRL